MAAKLMISDHLIYVKSVQWKPNYLPFNSKCLTWSLKGSCLIWNMERQSGASCFLTSSDSGQGPMRESKYSFLGSVTLFMVSSGLEENKRRFSSYKMSNTKLVASKTKTKQKTSKWRKGKCYFFTTTKYINRYNSKYYKRKYQNNEQSLY